MVRHLFAILSGLLVAAGAGAQTHAEAEFALHDGDRVVFYGDSITDQRLYTKYVEEYVLTRFPGMKVDFVNAGVGGDQVSGGVAGPIGMRLERDVFPYHPTMVTIMLGMNDGYYGPSTPGISSSYTSGYRRLVDALQTAKPEPALTLLEPSPFDDITRTPEFEGGYNSVLLTFGAFVQKLAGEKRVSVADLNAPVVAVLRKVHTTNAPLSSALIPDRVHPSPAIHWVMAQALLTAWNAGPIVSKVSLDAHTGEISESVNTDVSKIQVTKEGLQWIQKDRALPLPLPSKDSDPLTAVATDASGLNEALNQLIVEARNLKPGVYELQIDDISVGTYDAAKLDSGVDLAMLDTPMRAQARLVALDTEEKSGIESTAANLFRDPHVPAPTEALDSLNDARLRAIARQRLDAQPTSHRFVLRRVAGR